MAKATPQDVVFACHSMPQRIFDENTTRIKWFSLYNYDLKTTTSVLKDALLDEETPKNIVCAAYQKYAGFVPNDELCEHYEELLNTYRKQSSNKLMFASCLFLPCMSRQWDQVAKLNDSIRIYNIILGRSPLNLHKMGLTTISENDFSLRIKGGCYADYQLGLGVGKYYSLELLIRIKQHLINVFDHAFTDREQPRDMILKSVRVKTPPPLAATPGFMSNAFFKQELQDQGLISRSEEDEGAERLTFSEWRPTGWRHWDLYRYENLNTKEDREEALQRHLAEILQSSPRPVWGKVREDLIVEFDNDLMESSDQSSSEEDVEDEKVLEKGDVVVEERTVSMQESDDEEENSSSQQIEAEKVKVQKEKYNENEQLLADYKRAAEVNEELVNQYKQELGVYKVQVTKEKAAVKEWKKQTEIALADNKELSKLIRDQDRKISVLEAQIHRMKKEYKFLRNLYEDGSSRRVNGRRYANYEDFLESAKSAKSKK